MTLLPDKLTPLSHDDLIVALRDAFPVVFGRPAAASELAIYYAQCLEENGAKLDSLHCFGLGNVKATANWTGDTVQYQCDETVSLAEATHAQTLGPCALTPQSNGRVRVVCFPPHPWTTFRAFDSAAKAAESYLRIFRLLRYAQASMRAAAGDAVGFVEMAARGGYMTTPNVAGYAHAVAWIASHAVPACAAALAGNPPGIGDDDRARAEGIVALTLSETAFETDPNDATEPS